MAGTNFKIAILDDFEKVADTVPAYAKLKERADITLVRERLDSSEKIVARLRDFDALLLMRERTFFSDKEYGQLPKLKFIAQTGRTSVHLDLANATKRGIAISGYTQRQRLADQRTHRRPDPGPGAQDSPSQSTHARGALAGDSWPEARR